MSPLSLGWYSNEEWFTQVAVLMRCNRCGCWVKGSLRAAGAGDHKASSSSAPKEVIRCQ